HPSYPQTARAGITVLGDADGTWRPGRKIWNQHAYSITNVNDDGTIPATADLNWATHNSFRSGDLSAVDGGGSWPDLLGRVVEVCEERCSEGVIEVWVQLGNQGVEDIEPGSTFHLSALTPDGEVPLVAEVAPTDVASGSWQEGVHLIIEGVGDLDIRDLELVVDPDDDLSECDEDNNIARWGQGVCLF
ncbi:MAG: hypothetical protein H6739_08440, partial [Alphaproteobacteria bacterium]|nr:hypothetical protein [Alphaproteobacteria bacterium]